jgi:hypothetical protein
MKSSLSENVFNFILVYLSLTGLFNGVVALFLSTTIKFCIDVFLLFVFVMCNLKYNITINKAVFYFFCFYIFLTFYFLIFYVNDNSYGFMKLCRNVIINIFYLLFNIILFLYSGEKNINKYRKRLLKFIVLLEMAFFVYFILYNKKDGLLGHSLLQVIIFQDFWGERFQGTFSEPSHLGFCLGVCALLILLVCKSNLKYFISFVLVFILYYACRAKFALFSLPIAFLIGVLYSKSFKINYVYPYLLLLLLFSFIAIFYMPVIGKFYSLISQLESRRDLTATYVTRFSFLFISIKELFHYPLGEGMGLNYEYFRDGLKEIIVAANKSNLNTYEIKGYLTNPRNFGSKETLSIVISSFGLVGLFFYIKYFIIIFKRKYHGQIICNTLILFIFLQSIFSTSVTSSVVIVFLLYARMALYECER